MPTSESTTNSLLSHCHLNNVISSSPLATSLSTKQQTFKHAYIRMLCYGVTDAESIGAVLRNLEM